MGFVLRYIQRSPLGILVFPILMKTVRYIAIAGLAITGLTMVWFALLSVLPGPFEARWIAGIYERKEAAADAVLDTPRYLIIGGSGVHYSYSAERASTLTGLNFVNLGTHAGLGIDYILDRATASLRPGDTAILALEYHLIEGSKATSILSPFVLTQDLTYLGRAPYDQLLNLAFGYPPIDVIKQVAATTMPWTSPLYHVDAVSSFGDETANTEENKQPYMRVAVESAGPVPDFVRDPALPPVALVKFAEWAKANHVRLVMSWPVIVGRPEYDLPNYRAYFSRYAKTFSALGFAVLNENYRDYFLPVERMLDGNFHADAIGARIIGQKLADDFRRSGFF